MSSYFVSPAALLPTQDRERLERIVQRCRAAEAKIGKAAPKTPEYRRFLNRMALGQRASTTLRLLDHVIETAPAMPTDPVLPRGQHEGGEADPERRKREAAAIEYIKGYTGTFGLILDLRAKQSFGSKWFRLSDRQIEVVLASKAREATWKAQREAGLGRYNDAPIGTDRLDLSNLPEGFSHFAVHNEQGSITFFRFRRIAADARDRYTGEPYRWAGWVFVDQQQSDDYAPAGRINPAAVYTGPWPTMVEKIVGAPLEAMALYGHEIGRCGYCNRTLTNEASRVAGIGPVCAKRLRGENAEGGED